MQTNGFVGIEHDHVEPFFAVLISSLDHWSNMRSKSHVTGSEFPNNTDRIEFPAEVAQLVEQWSEEPCVASSILALGTELFCWAS